MGINNRHLRIRLSEAQYRKLSEFLSTERRSKSQLVRDAIYMYLVENVYKKEAEEIRPPAGQ